jgi:hypothetical protein
LLQKFEQITQNINLEISEELKKDTNYYENYFLRVKKRNFTIIKANWLNNKCVNISLDDETSFISPVVELNEHD